MMNPTLHSRTPVPAPPVAVPLPPDLDALLSCLPSAPASRAGLIIPPGCGKILLGLSYAEQVGLPCLLVAPDRPTADLWARRWQKQAGGLSRDPLHPDRRTVTDRDTLADCDLRTLLTVARQAGIGLLLVDEPYSASDAFLSVLERLGEVLPGARMLSLSAYPAYDLPPERRTRVEAVCGAPVGMASETVMVRRGILAPHTDRLYLCHPSNATAERTADRTATEAAAAVTSAATVEVGATVEIAMREAAERGEQLRLLAVVSAGADALADALTCRAGIRTVGVEADVWHLPTAVADRLCRLCGGCPFETVRPTDRPQGAGSVACRPTRPQVFSAAIVRLFEQGAFHALAVGADPSPTAADALDALTALTALTAVNVLILSPDARPLHDRTAMIRLREGVLCATRDAHAETVNIWYPVADAPVDARERADAVRAWLRCVPTATDASRETPEGAFDNPSPIAAEIPASAAIRTVTPRRIVGLILSAAAAGMGGWFLPHMGRLAVRAREMPLAFAVFAVLFAAAAGLFLGGIGYWMHRLPLLWQHRTAQASVQSVARALLRAHRKIGTVSKTATVHASAAYLSNLRGSGHYVTVTVDGVPFAEANRFLGSLCELLSPVRSPRYILLCADRTRRKGRPSARRKRPTAVLSCPTAFSAKDADAAVLAACMRRSLGHAELIYTRREPGRTRLSDLRKKGHIPYASAESICRVVREGLQPETPSVPM